MSRDLLGFHCQVVEPDRLLLTVIRSDHAPVSSRLTWNMSKRIPEPFLMMSSLQGQRLRQAHSRHATTRGLSAAVAKARFAGLNRDFYSTPLVSLKHNDGEFDQDSDAEQHTSLSPLMRLSEANKRGLPPRAWSFMTLWNSFVSREPQPLADVRTVFFSLSAMLYQVSK
eukprot:m.271952 g.271952  ORF g.271952 m.271952 type:complete len:169 (-) comp15684_c1_seq5:4989-5495(-)